MASGKVCIYDTDKVDNRFISVKPSGRPIIHPGARNISNSVHPEIGAAPKSYPA